MQNNLHDIRSSEKCRHETRGFAILLSSPINGYDDDDDYDYVKLCAGVLPVVYLLSSF